jgi:lactate permease
MYRQVLDPVGGSLFASSMFALLALAALFVLLGGLKLKAPVAALLSLLVSILFAIVVYSMPVGPRRSRRGSTRRCSRPRTPRAACSER